MPLFYFEKVQGKIVGINGTRLDENDHVVGLSTKVFD